MRTPIKELWIIVECPHCHRPQAINRWWVAGGLVYNLAEARERNCKVCEKPYKIEYEIIESEDVLK